MNIQSEVIGREKHISVMGLLDSQEDRQYLVNLLHEHDGVSEIHVTFFEAPTLPANIVEVLKFHIETCPDVICKIFVFHKHLSSYLNRLGIHNTLVFKKSLVQQAAQRIKAVAIGGSAESLDKILTIVAALPLADISVFIVQHFPKDAHNILDTLVQDRTLYRAVIARHRMKVEENVIYIAPSNFHMKVKNGYIILTQEDPVNYSRPSIDVLFESVAEEYKGSLLAILLCGYGNDGSFL